MLPEFRLRPDPASDAATLQLVLAAAQEEEEGRRKTGTRNPESRNIERRIRRRRNDADDARQRRRVGGRRRRRLERDHRDRRHFFFAEDLILRTGTGRRGSGFAAETDSGRRLVQARPGQEVERVRMPETFPVPLQPLFKRDRRIFCGSAEQVTEAKKSRPTPKTTPTLIL